MGNIQNWRHLFKIRDEYRKISENSRRILGNILKFETHIDNNWETLEIKTRKCQYSFESFADRKRQKSLEHFGKYCKIFKRLENYSEILEDIGKVLGDTERC